ncbi:MAG TPA: ABATE domain-containing protein [Nevskiaceae bacterium]
MHESVDSDFPLLGEPLCVDLVNTRARRDGAVVDLLDGVSALKAWLALERARGGWRGAVSAADLVAVRELRDAVDGLLRARAARRHPSPDAVDAVNLALSARVPEPRLAWTGRDPERRWETKGAAGARDTFLRQVALDTVELLTGPRAQWLRKCAHPDCMLLFVADNRRRRWCSSARCGNRARVARHYSRVRGRAG